MAPNRRDSALEQDGADSPAADPKKERLARARASFKAIQTAEASQRERENADIQFYDGDQWPADVKVARAGMNASNGLPPVPARPCLVINKAREPVRQVLNQERQSDIGVTIVPADDFGGMGEPVSDQEIELREGLVRRIQRTSDAASARTWAFERATIAGRGYYGVMTRFGDGPTRDKEIFIRRFYNQGAISLGPHEEPDGSDVEEAFIGSFISTDQFIADYAPDGTPDEFMRRIGDDDDFRTELEQYKDWYREDGEGDKKRKMIHICEHWYTERTSRKLVFLSDYRDVWDDELTAADKALMNDADGNPIGSRQVVEKQIKFEIIAGGTQTYDETDWDGHYIPIIKVLGEELQPYDSERRCEGMVRPGRDAGIGFNVMISKLVETVGLTPIPALILDPESIENYEEWYKVAATRALPYLPQRTRGDDGREFREAHRPSVDPNLQPLAMATQMFSEGVQSTMGVHDPSFGKVDPRLKSGKAIQSVVEQDQHGTSNYMDNLHRSVHFEGLVINDLLYPTYGRPGRIAKMIGRDNETRTIPMHKPFVMQGGKPQTVPEGTPGAQTYTLSKDAKLNVAIKVTKQADLRRDETAQFLGQLIQSNPEKFMAEFGDMFFNVLDVPEHKEMAERAKMMLDPRILASMDAKKQGMDVPPSVMAKMAQQGKQLKELEGIAHAQQQKLDTESVKAEADLKKAAMNADKDIRIKQMELSAKAEEAAKDREVELAKAEIAAKATSLSLFMEERARIGSQQHEAGIAAADAAHEADMSQQEHAQAIAQAAHAASLEPEPEPAAPPTEPAAAPAEPAAGA